MSVDVTAKKKQDEGFMEIFKIVLHALILAMIVRVFLYQPFNIPSGSMKSNLLIGDYLFVSKFSYGYSRYSFPFGINLFEGRLLAGQPKRGDVAVFRLPRDPNIDYIKRVIGLPGDKIQMLEGILYINGNAVPKKRIGNFTDTDLNGNQHIVDKYEETLPNGIKYTVLDRTPHGALDNTNEFIVPPGHYFMMGDNRDDSLDSRAMSEVGMVPYENFIGRAEIIFFSANQEASWLKVWTWPLTTRWSRVFNLVR